MFRQFQGLSLLLDFQEGMRGSTLVMLYKSQTSSLEELFELLQSSLCGVQASHHLVVYSQREVSTFTQRLGKTLKEIVRKEKDVIPSVGFVNHKRERSRALSEVNAKREYSRKVDFATLACL